MVITRMAPQNLQSEHRELFGRSSRYDSVCPTIAELQNVFIFWQGQTFQREMINGKSLSTELFLSRYNKMFFYRGLISAWLRGKLFRMSDPCVVIHDEWSMNYFHWLTDALTRLYLVRNELHRLTLILPDSYANDYHVYVLKKMGVRTIHYTNARMLIHAQKMLLPIHTAPAGHYNPEILKPAVRLLMEGVSGTSAYGEKIYISRARAGSRKIINERDVQDCLVKKGFQILYMEDYGLEETIRIMKNVKILVSVHGAGLTNLMFMKPRSFLLELRNEDASDVYNTYFTLASVFEVLYYYLVCHSANTGSVQQSDILVNIRQLDYTCGEIMKRMEDAD